VGSGKRECPNCAVEVPKHDERCPICGYEFPQSKSGFPKWIVIVLIALLLILLFLIPLTRHFTDLFK
jgi:RNA polymerase subunit RPABC4/transcription elongation factor Spt4